MDLSTIILGMWSSSVSLVILLVLVGLVFKTVLRLVMSVVKILVPTLFVATMYYFLFV